MEHLMLQKYRDKFTNRALGAVSFPTPNTLQRDALSTALVTPWYMKTGKHASAHRLQTHVHTAEVLDVQNPDVHKVKTEALSIRHH